MRLFARDLQFCSVHVLRTNLYDVKRRKEADRKIMQVRVT